MPLPMIPIAVVAGAFALARNVRISPVDQRVEDRLDDLSDGVSVHKNARGDQVNAAYRWKRTLQFGNGPKVEVDMSALGRIQWKRIN